MQDTQVSEEEISRFIQLCLSEEEVPEEELKTFESIIESESSRAKEIALRILDESMIRSWFRSEADTVFINEVQKRLNIRFKDREFIEAVMSKVEEGIHANPTEGKTGESFVKEEVKSVSAIKYILVPIVAAVLYLCIFHMDFFRTFFRDADSFKMTVEDIQGRPAVITDGKRKTVVLKMLIKPGDTLNTGSNQTMKLKYPDQTIVELLPNSSALLVKSDSLKELQLLQGAFKLSVHPQGEATPFTLHTSNSDVRIQEGMTSISIQENNDLIEVLSGNAVIGRPGQGDNRKISAGSKASVSTEQVKLLDKENSKEENREISNE